MIDSSLAYLPTVQQLLETEVFAEAQVLVGENNLAKMVSQVVSGFSSAPRPDSLVVVRPDSVTAKDHLYFPSLAALVVVRSATSDSSTPNKSLAAPVVGSTVKAPVTTSWPDVALEKLVNLCSEAQIALISIQGFGETAQIADDIRIGYLKEVKLNGMRLHANLLRIVLAEGLEGLVEQLSLQTNRPISIETANFQVLASRNMGATPVSQQQTVTEQIALAVERAKKSSNAQAAMQIFHPLKVGRRLILPILLDDVAVGYISAMTKSSDNLEVLAEYLQPAASAATVDFHQRRKDGSIFSVTQKSLLKDLLSGRGLSAADQERVERHYGFDLADGLLVMAAATASGDLAAPANWLEENLATTEVEGTRIFVLPYHDKDGKSWQQVAEALVVRLKQSLTNKESKGQPKIQLGVARLAANILGLAEAYREARQALIVGSMIRVSEEFVIGYGALGVKRLLYLMIDHPELERFYEENLAPLESYDSEWESELVPSLRVYLEQGANLNSAARALFIHRHTLRYRLEQIADILKVDIDSQETLLNLQIAFLIKEMKHSAAGTSKA